MNKQLDIGWCIGYMALQFHMGEALLEKGSNQKAVWDPPYALFSRKYYNEINQLNHDKKYDFCFIGSINSNYNARQWVIEFAKKYFTANSIFINTDKNPSWKSLGEFDKSHQGIGFCPKNVANNQTREVQYRVIEENRFYFETMCQSRFVLCPAGDAPWSFRMYEVLMCKSIPLVESWHHTYRTKEEAEIPYKYVLLNETSDIKYQEFVDENTRLFEQYHLL